MHVVEENAEVLNTERDQILHAIDKGVANTAGEIIEGFIGADPNADPDAKALAKGNKLRNLPGFLQGMRFHQRRRKKGSPFGA